MRQFGVGLADILPACCQSTNRRLATKVERVFRRGNQSVEGRDSWLWVSYKCETHARAWFVVFVRPKDACNARVLETARGEQNSVVCMTL